MKRNLFCKTGFFSLFAAALFSLWAVAASCSNSAETRYVEVTKTPAGGDNPVSTSALKEASYILHYQQKVMDDGDGKEYVTLKSEGFALAHSEDKSSSPVAAGTEFKNLAKDFLGFDYRYGIQKDKTIYLYYTRSTIEYSFYKGDQAKLELLAKVSGTHGFTCLPPNVTIDGRAVTGWKDSKGAALPEKFMTKNDAFFSTGTGIGTKARPTATGDIVFCDGTAASIAEVNAAWKSGDPVLEEYKQNAIAAIVFDRYNAATGSAYGGDKIIGVGIQALNGAYPNDGSAAVNFKDMFNGAWRNNGTYKVTHICPSNHGWQDLCDLKALFGEDPFKNSDYFWTAIYKAINYGATLKSNTDMDIDKKLLDGWYLPNWREMGLLAAYDYKYKETLKAACNALDFSDFDCTGYWVTASKTQGDDPVYAAYINPNNSYKDFKLLMNGGDYDAAYWAQAIAGSCQSLPFRVFK